MCRFFHQSDHLVALKIVSRGKKIAIFLTIGFPIHLANRARSTPHGNAHRFSTVSSREVIEPILKSRKIGLQHMLKTKKLKILTEDPPYPLNNIQVSRSIVLEVCA